MIIIGVDCAVDDKNVGLAKGSIYNSKLVIDEVATGGGNRSVKDQIIRWLPEEQPVLLALDAPLGWPASLPAELSTHFAGERLSATPNEMFSRMTDRVVHNTIGKKPLDVGADRIARTAHAALALLQNLRERTGQRIPMAWDPDEATRVQAIEVYPAATLASLKINAHGYKKTEGNAGRRELLKKLENGIGEMVIEVPHDQIIKSPHMLDAIICVLAAYDFLTGKCFSPADVGVAEENAKKEGWIWVRGGKKAQFEEKAGRF